MYSISEISQLTGLTESHLLRRDGRGPVERIKQTIDWRSDLFVDEDGQEYMTEEGMGFLLDYLAHCGKDGDMSYEEWQQSIRTEHGQLSSLVPAEVYEPELLSMPDAQQHISDLRSQMIIMADEIGVQNKHLGAEMAHRMFSPLVESFNQTSEDILKKSFGNAS
ncbi:MAG: hypothetical protein AAFO04_29640 [Cyanobacteria bacterium J06592_8]